MKLNIANQSKQQHGGGFSFIDNLVKGLQKTDVEFVDWPDADIILIPSSSMIDKYLFKSMKKMGKKIILRIDNVPRNSRNRNTGTSRLKLMADGADEVVYQSSWAREYLKPFTKREGVLIHNSVDETIFRPLGESRTYSASPVFLYSRFSRDETKSWERAWYEYQMWQRKFPDALLLIVGQFSKEIVEYNFDFFMGERHQYLGVMQTPQRMAEIYRSADNLIAPYFNDCFSQTYIEALLTGLELVNVDYSGGTIEMIETFRKEGRKYFYLERMVAQYISIFNKVLG